jgi:hypothetical protein
MPNLPFKGAEFDVSAVRHSSANRRDCGRANSALSIGDDPVYNEIGKGQHHAGVSRMKIAFALFAVLTPIFVSAQTAASPDAWDTVITIQPTSDASYTERFSSRRQAVAMRDDPKMSNVDKGRAAVVDFAQCLYDSDKGGARRVLSSGPGAPLKSAVVAFANGQCWLRGFISFRPSALQGGLFVVAYRNQFRSKSPGMMPEPIDYAAIARAVNENEVAPFVALRRFGECVVRSNVDGARALALSDVASAVEARAFADISPGLSACIDAGRSVTLTKELVKYTVSEVLYRHGTQIAAAGGRP